MSRYRILEDTVVPRSRQRIIVYFSVILNFLFVIYFFFGLEDTSNEYSPPMPKIHKSEIWDGILKDNVSEIFQKWHECIYPSLLPIQGDYEKFWYQFVNRTEHCDNVPKLQEIDLRSVENSDEVKYVAYPKRRYSSNLTMVTLGIGHDTGAEEKLKLILPQTDFFGVDPIQNPNKQLYESLGGEYFPFAVSGVGGLAKSNVFRWWYRNEVTLHIEAAHFFEKIVKRKKIDILWIDTEGNEFSLIDLLHNGEEFEKRGIKICQMNIEMHKNAFKGWKGDKKRFHDFVWRILSEGKYIMMKPYWVTSWFKGYIRTFILNVQDRECVDLYVA